MKFHSTAAISFAALSVTVFCFGYGAWTYWEKGAHISAVLFVFCALLFLVSAAKIALTHGITMPTQEDEAAIKQKGKLVITQFKAIDRRWNIQVNGQSPIIIFSEGTDPTTKQSRVFESKDLWLSGGDASQYKNPAFTAWQTLQNADPSKTFLIPVYIDKMNPTRYFMDLSGVEEKK